MAGSDPVVLALGFVLITSAFALITQFINRVYDIGLPFTLVMFVVGLILALIVDDGKSEFDHVVKYAAISSPSTLVMLVLPPAIFAGALKADFHAFVKSFWSSILLAFPVVTVAGTMTAVVIKLAFVQMNFDWPAAFMLAAILSATDPVAVVDSMHALGAPARLGGLIEVESMLNDGTAFVFFVVFREIVAGKDVTFGTGLGTFLRLTFGGPIAGAVIFVVMAAFLRRLHADPAGELLMVMVGVYFTFYLCEHVIGVSSVLATVTLGLLFNAVGKYGVSANLASAHMAMWEMWSFFSTAMIFSLAGVIVFDVMVHSPSFSSGHAWGYLILLVVTLVIVRALALAMFFPLLSRLNYALTWAECAYVAFSGLRGGIALALLIILSSSDGIATEVKRNCSFLGAGAVLLTTLLLGSTGGWVYRKMNLYPLSESEREFSELTREVIAMRVAEKVTELRASWLFANADWDLVCDLVPDLNLVTFGSHFVPPPHQLSVGAALSAHRQRTLQRLNHSTRMAAINESRLTNDWERSPAFQPVHHSTSSEETKSRATGESKTASHSHASSELQESASDESYSLLTTASSSDTLAAVPATAPVPTPVRVQAQAAANPKVQLAPQAAASALSPAVLALRGSPGKATPNIMLQAATPPPPPSMPPSMPPMTGHQDDPSKPAMRMRADSAVRKVRIMTPLTEAIGLFSGPRDNVPSVPRSGQPSPARRSSLSNQGSTVNVASRLRDKQQMSANGMQLGIAAAPAPSPGNALRSAGLANGHAAPAGQHVLEPIADDEPAGTLMASTSPATSPPQFVHRGLDVNVFRRSGPQEGLSRTNSAGSMHSLANLDDTLAAVFPVNHRHGDSVFARVRSATMRNAAVANSATGSAESEPTPAPTGLYPSMSIYRPNATIAPSTIAEGLIRSYFTSLRARYLEMFERGEVSADTIAALVIRVERFIEAPAGETFGQVVERYFKALRQSAMIPRWVGWIWPPPLLAYMRRAALSRAIQTIWATVEASHDVLEESSTFANLTEAEQGELVELARRLARVCDGLLRDNPLEGAQIVAFECARRAMALITIELHGAVERGELTENVAHAAVRYIDLRMYAVS